MQGVGLGLAYICPVEVGDVVNPHPYKICLCFNYFWYIRVIVAVIVLSRKRH